MNKPASTSCNRYLPAPHSSNLLTSGRVAGRIGKLLSGLCALLLMLPATAEQSQKLGNYTVHYVAFASTFLSPEMARKYDVVRGRNRALINISVLDENDKPVRATLSGEVKNLPGQIIRLVFEEVLEGDAVYYLTQTRFSDQELMRFNIEITGPDGIANTLKFQQKMYWED